MCDVEQRLNTENINLATQSSKESISALHCAHFDQLFQFLRGFCLPARCEARRKAGKSAFARNLQVFCMQFIDNIK
jgi:hypothetical protein